jgi:hypothetical protein
MTTRRQAAYPKGHIVPEPHISQHAASELLGAPIPDEAWQKITLAFARFGDGMAALATSRPNNAKNDPQSWEQQQRDSVADLILAHKCIDRVTRDRKQFLMDALDNYSMQERGHSGLLEVMRELNDMKIRLVRAMTMIERAKPYEIEVPTEATQRSNLIAAIHRAILDAGLPATLSSKGEIPRLTPFEEMLKALGIERGNSDPAFAMKVRRAVKNLG